MPYSVYSLNLTPPPQCSTNRSRQCMQSTPPTPPPLSQASYFCSPSLIKLINLIKKMLLLCLTEFALKAAQPLGRRCLSMTFTGRLPLISFTLFNSWITCLSCGPQIIVQGASESVNQLTKCLAMVINSAFHLLVHACFTCDMHLYSCKLMKYSAEEYPHCKDWWYSSAETWQVVVLTLAVDALAAVTLERYYNTDK